MKRTVAFVAVVMVFVALATGCSKKEKEAAKPEVDADAMVEEAISAVSAGKLDEGMKLFNKVLEVAPDNARAHCGLGTIYRDKGDMEKAVEMYKMAIEIDPDYVICNHLLGFAYLKLDDFDNAEKFLKKAGELDPAYADSHFDLGQLYGLARKVEDAVSELEKFIELTKDVARVEEAKTLIEKIKSGEGEPVGQKE